MKRHEVDSEAFEKVQFTSITKAINQDETAAKEKHIRTTVMGTYQEKGAMTFWNVVPHLQLSKKAVSCWKFCHVLHKILRDGHENALDHSLRYKQLINDLGNNWGYATTGYGTIISRYCKYLTRRLEFTGRYDQFSGDLAINDATLEAFGNAGKMNYHDLCVGIMDCLECLMDLQESIFRTLDVSKNLSATGPGQCRLAPCIPIIRDAKQLHECLLSIMYKLHSTSEADSLSSHRERFSVLFSKLKKFYVLSSNMQYITRLVQPPVLPDEPPDFMIKP